MIHYKICFFLLLGCLGLGRSASAQTATAPLIRLQGKVINGTGFKNLAYANVGTNGSRQVIFADSSGKFSIFVYPSDTLKVGYLGFIGIETPIRRLMPSDSSSSIHHVFVLVPTEYVLKEVRIYSYSREEFIRAFMLTPQDSLAILAQKRQDHLEKMLKAGLKADDKQVDMIDYMMKNPNEFRNFTISDYRGTIRTLGAVKYGMPISFAKKAKPYVKRF